MAKVDEALTQQRDLLAEFEKVADELNKILANLEGSTLVKRLKAASRLQITIAGKISDQVDNAFGLFTPKTASPAGTPVRRAQVVGGANVVVLHGANAAADVPAPAPPKPETPLAKTLEELGIEEAKGSHGISLIMDDMAAYFERRQYARFKAVLDEMRQKDVIGALRQLGDDLQKEQGVSIAQCEFWSDSLDRWADDLVDPSTSGACPGSKSKSSLPPSVVLEVLQILEGEVNLREETRVAEQARPALAAEDFGKQAPALSQNPGRLQGAGRQGEPPDQGAARQRERSSPRRSPCSNRSPRSWTTRPPSSPRPTPAPRRSPPRPTPSNSCSRPSGSTPRAGAGAARRPAAAGGGPPRTSALALMGNGMNKEEVRQDRGDLASDRRVGPRPPRRIPLRAGSVLQQARTRAGQPLTDAATIGTLGGFAMGRDSQIGKLAAAAGCAAALAAGAASLSRAAGDGDPPVPGQKISVVGRRPPTVDPVLPGGGPVEFDRAIVVRPALRIEATRQVTTESQLAQMLGSELRLLTATARPTPDQRRAIALAGGRAIKECGRDAGQWRAGGGSNRRHPAVPDPHRFIRDALGAAVVQQLGTDQSGLYLREWDARDQARKEAATLDLVARIDQALLLSREQRDRVAAALRTQWDSPIFPTPATLATQDDALPSFLPHLIGATLAKEQRQLLASRNLVNFGRLQVDAFHAADGTRYSIEDEADDPDLKAALAEVARP